MGKEKSYQPPWRCEFVPSDGFGCLLCGQTERPMLVPESSSDSPQTRPRAGICESCSIHAHWAWRRISGEVPPGFDEAAATKATLVKLLVPRLAEDAGKVSEGLVTNYKFLLVPDGEHFDMPGSNLAGGESEFETAKRILESLNMKTWEVFIEPFYIGYTARGSLAKVLLVTAWTKIRTKDGLAGEWKPWPIENHVVAGKKGFSLVMEDVWRLRLHKHLSQPSRPSRISFEVREGAAEYIEIQRRLRAKEQDIDLSMIEYLRRPMTEDEKWADQRLQEWEESSADLARQQAIAAAEAAEVSGVSEGDDLPEDEEKNADGAGEDADEDGAAGSDSQSGSEDEEADGRGAPSAKGSRPGWGDLGIEPDEVSEETSTDPPEGFARRGKPLTMEVPKPRSGGG